MTYHVFVGIGTVLYLSFCSPLIVRSELQTQKWFWSEVDLLFGGGKIGGLSNMPNGEN